MGRGIKVRKLKKKKTFRVNINRKRLWRKSRKLPNINCLQIKEAWSNNKSTKTNLIQMGLAYDANKSVKIPSVKTEMIKTAKRKVAGELLNSDCSEESQSKRIPKKVQVSMALEEEAKAPRERLFRLPKGQVKFLTDLMDKYGDDYQAMARDKKNYYQLTWKQIRSKINRFKGIPEQYAEYLLAKGEIILEDPTPLVETKKQIAEENVKKYCTRKEKKKSKQIVSQWDEESLEDEDNFNTEKTINDNIPTTNGVISSENKLKLFSDDEEEDKEQEEMMKTVDNKKKSRKEKLLERLPLSDSEELEDDDGDVNFKDLNDMSDEELSDDDVLDDGEFVTDSDEE